MSRISLANRQAVVDSCALVGSVVALAIYFTGGATEFLIVGVYGLVLGTGTLVVTCSLLWFTYSVIVGLLAFQAIG